MQCLKRTFIGFLIFLSLFYFCNPVLAKKVESLVSNTKYDSLIKAKSIDGLTINKKKIALKTSIYGYDYAYEYTLKNETEDTFYVEWKYLNNQNSRLLKDYCLYETPKRFPVVLFRPVNLAVQTALTIPVVLVCPLVLGFLEDAGPMRDIPQGIDYYLLEPVKQTVGFPYFYYKDAKKFLPQYEQAKIFTKEYVFKLEPNSSIVVNVLTKDKTPIIVKKANEDAVYWLFK